MTFSIQPLLPVQQVIGTFADVDRVISELRFPEREKRFR